jgi:hypothetical protein
VIQGDLSKGEGLSTRDLINPKEKEATTTNRSGGKNRSWQQSNSKYNHRSSHTKPKQRRMRAVYIAGYAHTQVTGVEGCVHTRATSTSRCVHTRVVGKARRIHMRVAGAVGHVHTRCIGLNRRIQFMLEYNGCARFTIDNISIVTQP